MLRFGSITALCFSCIIIDLVNKYALFTDGVSTNAFIIKAVIFIVFLGKQNSVNTLILVLLLFSMMLAYIFVLENENIYFEIYILFRFTIVCTLFILLFKRLSLMDLKSLKNQFEQVLKVFQLNLFFIFLGLIFNIRIFAMDENVYREGYTGILPFSGNEVNYFFITVLIYLYFQLKKSFSNRPRSRTYRRMLAVYCIMGILSGLKLSMFVSVLFLILIYPFSLFASMSILLISFRESLQSLYLVTHLASRSILDWLSSGRISKFYDTDFTKSILFGERKFIQFEMDHFSLFYSYGLFGMSLMLVWKFYLLVAWQQSKSAFFLLISVFAGTFVAGHLFTSVFAMPWLAISFVILLKDQNVCLQDGSLQKQ